MAFGYTPPVRVYAIQQQRISANPAVSASSTLKSNVVMVQWALGKHIKEWEPELQLLQNIHFPEPTVATGTISRHTFATGLAEAGVGFAPSFHSGTQTPSGWWTGVKYGRDSELQEKNWRRGSESNRRIKVLQTSPLPLGYRALKLR